MAAAFKKCVNKAGSAPAALTSDGGMEFSAEFKELLETKGIVPRQKDKDDVNALATLDTAIGNLKKKGAGTGHPESGHKRLGIKASKGNKGTK